jgi:hypothetical protein
VNKRTLVLFAAAALISFVSAASAAPGAATNSGVNVGGLHPTDRLELSQQQRQTAWNDLYLGSLNQNTPSGFNAVAGAKMPHNVVTAPVTHKAVNDVPALKPYKFAMVQQKLVIVNPTDRKIAAVIRE